MRLQSQHLVVFLELDDLLVERIDLRVEVVIRLLEATLVHCFLSCFPLFLHFGECLLVSRIFGFELAILDEQLVTR